MIDGGCAECGSILQLVEQVNLSMLCKCTDCPLRQFSAAEAPAGTSGTIEPAMPSVLENFINFRAFSIQGSPLTVTSFTVT